MPHSRVIILCTQSNSVVPIRSYEVHFPAQSTMYMSYMHKMLLYMTQPLKFCAMLLFCLEGVYLLLFFLSFLGTYGNNFRIHHKTIPLLVTWRDL